MDIFDEDRFRAVVADVVRDVVREELARTGSLDDFLPTAEAADVAHVPPDTIRAWVKDRGLFAYYAGREMRIRRSDLEAFLAKQRATEEVSHGT